MPMANPKKDGLDEPKALVTIIKRTGVVELEHVVALEQDASGTRIASSLTDFLEALLVEVGSPAMIFSQAALRDRVKAAAVRVVDSMKAESVKLT